LIRDFWVSLQAKFVHIRYRCSDHRESQDWVRVFWIADHMDATPAQSMISRRVEVASLKTTSKCGHSPLYQQKVQSHQNQRQSIHPKHHGRRKHGNEPSR
jgi:hypothetical protein